MTVDSQPSPRGGASTRSLVDFPIHPFLFAGYAVLALLADNIQEAPIRDALRSFVFAFLLAGLTLAVAWLLTRSAPKAGLIASLLIVAFFAYGHVYDLVRTAALGGFLLGRHRFLAPSLFLLVAGAGTAIALTRRPLRGANRILNAVAAAAVVLALIPIAVYARAAIIQGQNPWGSSLERIHLTPPPGRPPDIYYIILDGYARSDYMASEFGYDNSEFLAFLEDRGFYVAEESRANHMWTPLSLASSLNMAYVQDLGLPLVPGSYPSLFVEPIQNSRVRAALESVGYATVALRSGYIPTEIVDADVYLDAETAEVDIQDAPLRAGVVITPFESQLLFTTPLRLLASQIAQWNANWIPPRLATFPDDVLRSIVLSAFENLAQVPPLPGPKFVFAHIVSPHAPYLFTADGEAVPRDGPFSLADAPTSAEPEDVGRYRDQAVFVTRQIEPIIDSILAGSVTQPIIILQSDHGSGSGDPWGSARAPGIDQRTSILNALLLPAPCRDELYPSITPVNSYRLVFNCVFGTSLPLLPDRSYFTPGLGDGGPYRFTLVDEPSDAP